MHVFQSKEPQPSGKLTWLVPNPTPNHKVNDMITGVWFGQPGVLDSEHPYCQLLPHSRTMWET